MTAPQVITAPVRLPDNPYLLKAVAAALPQYQDALNREQQADTLLRDLAPVPPVAVELGPGTDAAEWLDAVRAREIAAEEYDARRRILLQHKQKCAAISSSILEAGWNRLTRVLHSDLMAILDVAEAIGRELGSASTAQQAIALDAGDAWKRLTGLADEYDAVRDAQEFIAMRWPSTYLISSRPTLGGDEHASDLYLRGLDSLWPSWRNPSLFARVNIDGRRDRLEPWPPDRTELLLWLVRNRSTAQPWVPSTSDLDRLWRERREPANTPTKPDDDQPEPEREPYESLLIGRPPPQHQRQVPNQPPRASSYGRPAPEFDPTSRASELAELNKEGVNL